MPDDSLILQAHTQRAHDIEMTLTDVDASLRRHVPAGKRATMYICQWLTANQWLTDLRFTPHHHAS